MQQITPNDTTASVLMSHNDTMEFWCLSPLRRHLNQITDNSEQVTVNKVKTGFTLCLFLCYLLLAYCLRAHQPETVAAATAVRVVVVPTDRTRVGLIDDPTPAAYHPVRPRSRSCRISLRIITGITAIPVPTPLPYVPAHVI
jgi:hypothetical protein